MSDTDFRPLSDSESQVLKRLLEEDFVGREQLLSQLPGLLIRQMEDDEFCKEFEVHSGTLSPVSDGMVVEARYPDYDADSNPARVNMLLHIKDRLLCRLEVYKDDHSAIVAEPNPDKLEVFSGYPRVGHLRMLENEKMSDCSFTRDYFELVFDDKVLRSFSPLIGRNNQSVYNYSESGFHDMVRNLVGVRVVAVNATSLSIVLRFENDITLTIQLDQKSRRGPEAARFSVRGNNRIRDVW